MGAEISEIGGGTLASINRREARVKAALKEIQRRRREQEKSDRAHLEAVIGSAMLAAAERSREIKLMVEQILQSADLAPSVRAFLRVKGWAAGKGA